MSREEEGRDSVGCKGGGKRTDEKRGGVLKRGKGGCEISQRDLNRGTGMEGTRDE